MATCSQCGKVLSSAGHKFCPDCGAPLSTAQEGSSTTARRPGWWKRQTKRTKTFVILGAAILVIGGCAAATGGGKSSETPTPAATTPSAKPTTASATTAPSAQLTKPAATSAPAVQPTSVPQATSIRTSTSIPLPTSTPLPSNTPRPAATATTAVPGFGEGMKIVGTDVMPGTWRSMGGSGCYWERLSGFGGTLGEILANDNASGPAVVTIAATDKGFKSTRCGRWTQALAPITSSPTAPFSDGTFIVNKDIAPGTWRSAGGSGCYWARLGGFSGTLADIIANENITGSTVVTIGPEDAGFSSARCGTWTKIN